MSSSSTVRRNHQPGIATLSLQSVVASRLMLFSPPGGRVFLAPYQYRRAEVAGVSIISISDN